MPPTILTVDDAKAVRTLVENTLAGFDCELTTATNGFEAFFAIERVRPALILLDVSMPIMGGVETLRRLKATPELADIPVIMLTSRADHTIVPLLPNMGAVGNVLKPFDEATVLAAIQSVLKLQPVPN